LANHKFVVIPYEGRYYFGHVITLLCQAKIILEVIGQFIFHYDIV